jgi:hypothetical protein
MTQATLKPTGTYVKEVTVIDPDSKWEVELSVFKHSNGGMFAIDSSFIVQCMGPDDEDDDTPLEIQDPFEETGTIILLGV